VPFLSSCLSCPGPYLDDPKVAKEFTDAYMEMVGGFLTFPLKFPGTAVWRAMKVCLCTKSRAPAEAPLLQLHQLAVDSTANSVADEHLHSLQISCVV
jgi:hypothetical protein